MKYRFDRHEHSIDIKPHGNAITKNKPFSRSKASTISLLRERVQKKPLIQVLQEVENIRGGVMGGSSMCDLLHNWKQNLQLAIQGKVQRE